MLLIIFSCLSVEMSDKFHELEIWILFENINIILYELISY